MAQLKAPRFFQSRLHKLPTSCLQFVRVTWSGRAVKGQDERPQNRAHLTALLLLKEKCFHFALDNADVVIEGKLRQTSGVHFDGRLSYAILKSF